MVQEIICKKGRCEDANPSYLDECIDCDLSKSIEHELLKKEMKQLN